MRHRDCVIPVTDFALAFVIRRELLAAQQIFSGLFAVRLEICRRTDIHPFNVVSFAQFVRPFPSPLRAAQALRGNPRRPLAARCARNWRINFPRRLLPKGAYLFDYKDRINTSAKSNASEASPVSMRRMRRSLHRNRLNRLCQAKQILPNHGGSIRPS